MLHHLLERNCVSSPPTARFASLNPTLSISSWTKLNPASNPFFINREEEQSPILPLSLSLSLSLAVPPESQSQSHSCGSSADNSNFQPKTNLGFLPNLQKANNFCCPWFYQRKLITGYLSVKSCIAWIISARKSPYS